MSNLASEAELQVLIEEAIRNETLAQLVVDEVGLLDAADNEGNGRLPHFSLDRLCRRAVISAGAVVLKSLDSLTLLRANKNVSMTRQEVLKPDVVCFNPEKESVVLFELKISSSAGRQAITELAAYEQEIKNYLPLMSEHDVHLVLVSSEWSVLMDHSVSSAVTWAGRKILCLQAEKVQGKLVLKTRIPQAWEITGSAMFPPEALVTMTVSLYDYQSDAGPRNDSELDPRLITALEVMGRTGDALGSHGFAMLWKDHWQQSMTAYNVTICCVAPFGLYRERRLSGAIYAGSDSLADALDHVVREYSPIGQSGAFFAIGESAFPLLGELFTPQWEGSSYWADERKTLMMRGEPVMFEFWGSLGRHAIDYVVNPAMRLERPGLLFGNIANWHDPRVAIPLIDQMSEPRILASGNVRWKDAYKLGFLLGLDRSLRKTIEAHPDAGALQCRYFWNLTEVHYALNEVEYLSKGAENINPPNPPLTFQHNIEIDDEEEFQRLLEWLMEEFFMEEPGHINAFICGLEGAPLFDEEGLQLSLTEEARQRLLTQIDKRIRSATTFVLRGLAAQAQEGSLLPDAERLLEQLKKQLSLSEVDANVDIFDVPANVLQSTWELSLHASDFLVHGVLHRQRPVDFSSVDWDWLRQGVMEAHQRGETNVGVILNMNGQLGTGPIQPGGIKLPIPKCNPAVEVMFLDETAMFTSIRVVAWSELKATEFHSIFGKEKHQNSEE
ncbi:MAG: hypothetical protein ACXWC4_09425 [Telluria sp.]